MSESAMNTPPEPNLTALLELLGTTLDRRGTITLTIERPLPAPYQAEVEFALDEIAFQRNLTPQTFAEAFAHMLIQIQRGSALAEDVDREDRIVREQTNHLLYGTPAPTRRPHLALVSNRES